MHFTEKVAVKLLKKIITKHNVDANHANQFAIIDKLQLPLTHFHTQTIFFQPVQNNRFINSSIKLKKIMKIGLSKA